MEEGQITGVLFCCYEVGGRGAINLIKINKSGGALVKTGRQMFAYPLILIYGF